jgi:hypothetical protein
MAVNKIGYVLLGTGAAILAYQPAALAADINAKLIDVPGFSFNATATGTASLSNSAIVRVPDTILEDKEYEGRLERFGGIHIIRTRFDRE